MTKSSPKVLSRSDGGDIVSRIVMRGEGQHEGRSVDGCLAERGRSEATFNTDIFVEQPVSSSSSSNERSPTDTFPPSDGVGMRRR